MDGRLYRPMNKGARYLVSWMPAHIHHGHAQFGIIPGEEICNDDHWLSGLDPNEPCEDLPVNDSVDLSCRSLEI